jgi:hypothetical protein
MREMIKRRNKAPCLADWLRLVSKHSSLEAEVLVKLSKKQASTKD